MDLKPGEERFRGITGEGAHVLTGKLMPVHRRDDQPVILTMPNNPSHFVPVFSTESDLRAAMLQAQQKTYKIKQITDGLDFAKSIIEAKCRIMLDPRVVDGNTRWTEITIT